MTKRLAHVALALTLALTVQGCRKKSAGTPPAKAAPVPPPSLESLFVLLPEPNGRSSRITVSNPSGSQQLTEANTVVRVAGPNSAPTAPSPIAPVEVQRLFGETLNLLPAEQVSFNLYFDVNTASLTQASQGDLARVLQAVRDRRSTLISVIGHTDTTGANRQSNYQLGLQRATIIAERLRAIGLAPEMILVASHGQDDLLVPTGPNQNEPRNRRVEITIR